MIDAAAPAPHDVTPQGSPQSERLGYLLVFLSALIWSFGGTIARFIQTGESWTIVFWRSVWAVAFLVAFMLWRDGWRGTLRLFGGMGLPGIGVGVCFTLASISFVVALGYTTVANILLIQAGVPLLAALLAWLLFGERISLATAAAIAAVIVGIGIMVSDSVEGNVSPVGNALALVIVFALAGATVITRRFARVRMTPATCLGALLAGCVAATQAKDFAVSSSDMVYLFLFGAGNLGLGLAFFATGARLVPAAIAALLGTFEPLLGPIWVWLVHGEVPSARTLVGGAIVFGALLIHIGREVARQSRSGRPGPAGMPAPN